MFFFLITQIFFSSLQSHNFSKPTFCIVTLCTIIYPFNELGTRDQSAKGPAPSKPSTPPPDPETYLAINLETVQRPANAPSEGRRRSGRVVPPKKPATIQRPSSTPSKKPHQSQRVGMKFRVGKTAPKKRGTTKKAPAGREPRPPKDAKGPLEANVQSKKYTGNNWQDQVPEYYAKHLGMNQ